MRKRFWQFVHDRLEDAWHWVYLHKLAEPLPPVATDAGYRYKFSYVVGRASAVAPNLTPAPVYVPCEKFPDHGVHLKGYTCGDCQHLSDIAEFYFG